MFTHTSFRHTAVHTAAHTGSVGAPERKARAVVRWVCAAVAGSVCCGLVLANSGAPAGALGGEVRKGKAAFGDWTTDAPGVRRLITVADLPDPIATPSVDNGPRQVARPDGAEPKVPAGFRSTAGRRG